MANVYNIIVQQGESYFLQVTSKDEASVPIDLSNYAVTGVVKLRYSDTGILLDLHPTITNAVSGIITVSLSGSETANLPITDALYNIDIVTGSYSQSVLGGTFSIGPCVLNNA